MVNKTTNRSLFTSRPVADSLPGMRHAKDAILDAADRRFADYGYAKTAMAEIAGDAGMSVGNLYRHFRSKDAIAAACVERLLQRKLDAGREAAQQETDALDALRAFLRTRLRIAHAHFARTRHMFDMMALINLRHRDLLLDYEARVIDTLAGIVARGVNQGRFATANARETAYDIHQATLRYNHPLHLKNNALERLESDLQRLVSLLFTGLAPRHSHKEVA